MNSRYTIAGSSLGLVLCAGALVFALSAPSQAGQSSAQDFYDNHVSYASDLEDPPVVGGDWVATTEYKTKKGTFYQKKVEYISGWFTHEVKKTHKTVKDPHEVTLFHTLK